jgi:hypothetical protein
VTPFIANCNTVASPTRHMKFISDYQPPPHIYYTSSVMSYRYVFGGGVGYGYCSIEGVLAGVGRWNMSN